MDTGGNGIGNDWTIINKKSEQNNRQVSGRKKWIDEKTRDILLIKRTILYIKKKLIN